MKRKLDVFNSPDSSTPPRPPAKKQHTGIPSDSPSNPFGLRLNSSLRLPHPSYHSDHFILRFQFGITTRNVYRVVSVPPDYNFWHLHKLAQFIFGWKLPDSRNGKRKVRSIEHRFEVLKDVTMCNTPQRVGHIKNGRTWAKMAGCSPAKAIDIPQDAKECTWYEEESFTIEHAWRKGPEPTRAVSYVWDWHGPEATLVYITIDNNKRRARRGEGNTPFVLEGRCLPNDDEDDEDFKLDLVQWNEPGAFEDFLEDDQTYSGETTMSLSSPDFSMRIEKSITHLNKLSEEELFDIKPEPENPNRLDITCIQEIKDAKAKDNNNKAKREVRVKKKEEDDVINLLDDDDDDL